tara:strand:+ start:303 stop:923 length:621 start_codon:yes stop_codon:yes gene_type:complete
MIKYLSLLLFIGLAFLSCEKIQKNDIKVKQYDSTNDDVNINALIEISAGTLEKWEYNKETKKIELELVNDKPRIINYLGYPANYGMIPKTLLAKKNGGDGDPLDVIVIGPPEPIGNIVKCKIIGILYLVDNFEQDDKLIAISHDSNLKKINDISELNDNYDGILKILEIWFKNYKGSGQIKFNGYGDSKSAENILANARNQFLNSQ